MSRLVTAKTLCRGRNRTHFSHAEHVLSLDKQHYTDLIFKRWHRNLSADTLAIAQSIYARFKDEMYVDPVDLVFEALRSQDSQRIVNLISRFYERLVLDGLREDSAWQYCVTMRGFFKANRISLRRMRRPQAPVPLGTIFKSPEPSPPMILG
jgi:hypothetical protein